MRATPFEVHIPQPVLDDLQERLARTRLPGGTRVGGWSYGTDRHFLEDLIRHWRDQFDWRAEERRLNALAHFRADIDGFGVHFIHERGKGPKPLPIVLTHGYPDSFVRFLKIIPLLTDPAGHGGDAADAFDVVVPSLPGYGFSDKPPKKGFTFRIGDLWHMLMTEVLGYERYGAHGGDWGSTVTEQLARSHGGALAGIHLTDVPFWHLFQKPSDPSKAEQAFFAKNDEWIPKEGGYALLQSTRPFSLATGLNDSPAGLAAWLADFFRRWSDCGGDIESRFTKDELLTNVMIYWATETIDSSFLPYYDYANGGALQWMSEAMKQWMGSTEDVPAAFALFPKDLAQPPREWPERYFNIQRWTEMPRGGHFAALEEPQLLVQDLREFFRPLRQHSSPSLSQSSARSGV